jgi:hypothetical protein
VEDFYEAVADALPFQCRGCGTAIRQRSSIMVSNGPSLQFMCG